MSDSLYKDQMEAKDCLICSSSKDIGIQLQGFLICCECEMSIVQAGVGDPNYRLYVNRLRRVRESLRRKKAGEVRR